MTFMLFVEYVILSLILILFMHYVYEYMLEVFGMNQSISCYSDRGKNSENKYKKLLEEQLSNVEKMHETSSTNNEFLPHEDLEDLQTSMFQFVQSL